jgi:hypothetical protein
MIKLVCGPIFPGTLIIASTPDHMIYVPQSLFETACRPIHIDSYAMYQALCVLYSRTLLF